MSTWNTDGGNSYPVMSGWRCWPLALSINYASDRSYDEPSRARTQTTGGGLLDFAKGYEVLGFNRGADGITYREWAPAVAAASLIGDFNGWNGDAHKMVIKLVIGALSHPVGEFLCWHVQVADEFGVWSITIPHGADGSPTIKHGTRVKVQLTQHNGSKAWHYTPRGLQMPCTHGTVCHPGGSSACVCPVRKCRARQDGSNVRRHLLGPATGQQRCRSPQSSVRT